ncbi:ABC transporter permease subunit [Kutzneria viridogrisea]|uniref:Binding-protein-dependent transporters inner membrane component n=2 Tax=Kutzneria TaxID=43356 RepID=W5W807_9PSEU|nr:ABC transporter permease [Kutzneria albida]AHH96870.1 binding-protein-dependent transporters inner membrane component [Kutzneria albida DSM 43870]MBA8927907.1 peptide/nickel transport system permease protein [Kutzneria viridogrisea]
MLGYVVRRLLGAIAVMLAMSAVVYVLFYLMPANPAQLVCGPKTCTADRLAMVEHSLGLDEPLYVQYWHFLSGLVVGRDFSSGPSVLHCPAPCLGYSFQYTEPVLDKILEALPVSLSIVIGAALLWLTFGIGAGVLSALRRGRWLDHAVNVVVLGGFAVPAFITSLLLLMVFCVYLQWLPFPSYVPFDEDPLGWAQNLVLPWIVLALVQLPPYVRLSRSGVLETLTEDHIRTARAYGLTERRVIGRHALRGALSPLITVAAADIAAVLTASMLTETAFGLPGLGRLMVQSVNQIDLPMVVGMTLLIGFVIVLCNAIADVLYAVVDRRVRVA